MLPASRASCETLHPRARQRISPCRGPGTRGFIPARAGRTQGRGSGRRRSGVHPRFCGYLEELPYSQYVVVPSRARCHVSSHSLKVAGRANSGAHEEPSPPAPRGPGRREAHDDAHATDRPDADRIRRVRRRCRLAGGRRACPPRPSPGRASDKPASARTHGQAADLAARSRPRSAIWVVRFLRRLSRSHLTPTRTAAPESCAGPAPAPDQRTGEACP